MSDVTTLHPGQDQTQQRMLLMAIQPGKFQPRKRFCPEKLKELADSISRIGVAQPILVRPIGDGRYEIVAGERRWRSSQLAGIPDIPVVVRDLTDVQALEIALIENDKREDLHPLEEAEGFAALLAQYSKDPEAAPGAHVEQLATMISKSRTHVYNRLKLLDLVPDLRELFYEGFIPTTLAEKLARMAMHLQAKALARLRKQTIAEGDPLPVRASIAILRKEFMLRLNAAPFSIKDEGLHPEAGACKTCPKRTGFEPDLFADVEHTDTCTDPVCYQVKVNAHHVVMKTKARGKGLEVIEGDNASALLKFGTTSDELNGDYVYMDRPLSNLTGNATPLKKLLGKHLQPSALFEHPKDKTLREIVQVTKAVDALRGQQLLVNDPELNKRAKQAQQADFIGIETSVAGKREDITAPGPATVVMLHDGSKPAAAADAFVPMAAWPTQRDAEPEDNQQIGGEHDNRAQSYTDDQATREHVWREEVFRQVHAQMSREWATPPGMRLLVIERLASSLNERTVALLGELWGWNPLPAGRAIVDHVREEAKLLDDEEIELLTTEMVLVGDLYPSTWALNCDLLKTDIRRLPLVRACDHVRDRIDWLALATQAGSALVSRAPDPDLPHVSPPPASDGKGDASQAGKPAEGDQQPNTSQAPQGAQGNQKDESDLPHWVGQMVKIKGTKRIAEVTELMPNGDILVATPSGQPGTRNLSQFASGEVEVLPSQTRPAAAHPATPPESGADDIEGADDDHSAIATPPKTKRMAPKYRQPLTGETWSGRGMKPKWLQVALERGKKLDDFLL